MSMSRSQRMMMMQPYVIENSNEEQGTPAAFFDINQENNFFIRN